MATSNWQTPFKKFRNRVTVPRENFIPAHEVPFELRLRQLNIIQRSYEKLRPLKYIVKLDYRYEREFMYDFMPVNLQDYIGRGSYKYVYRLPWNEVIKVGKNVLLSNPIFGSQYQQISRNPRGFLTSTEYNLMEYLCSRYMLQKNKREIRRKFYRHALEKLHYQIVKSHLPDLVVPTAYFMAVKFREQLFSKKVVPHIMPADVQPFLIGRHLKEFVKGATRESLQSTELFMPRWKVVFDHKQFGAVKKKIVKKLHTDLRRVVDFTRELAKRDKLIIDLHSENLIITLPDFNIRLFDYHLFDNHLYEPEERGLNPENEHIQLIENFIESFEKDMMNFED